MAKVIAITNQKGGVRKTVTSASLSVTLVEQGKKVLVVDFDPQGNSTKTFGYRDNHAYQYSLKDALFCEMSEQEMNWNECIIHTDESIDLIPSNIRLSGTDIQLGSVMSRETVFKRVLENYKEDYDYIFIDCNPSLNLFTINALTASDSVIIPVQSEPYATDGLNDLLHIIQKTKKQLNPNLEIDGILITMTDLRTNLSKHVSSEIRDKYGKHIHVFKTEIPRCVKTAESSLIGQSPILYSPKAESTLAYKTLAKEVLRLDGKKITRTQHQSVR